MWPRAASWSCGPIWSPGGAATRGRCALHHADGRPDLADPHGQPPPPLAIHPNVDLDAAMARRLRIGAVVIPGRRTAGGDPGDERAQLGPVRSDPGSGRLIG